MIEKYEKRINSRLIGLIMGKKKKKEKEKENKSTTGKVGEFMKEGVKQMKKDLKI
jgi:hypothetical protein